MAVCTSIELVENLNSTEDLMKVTIDNSVEAFWIFSYSESLKYLNQEVIVEYRKDIYKGELKPFISTFVIPTTIQTIDKKENIRLYTDQVDNNSNVSFSEIELGETRKGCIVYCTASEFKSSANAIWQELIIRDKSMHTAKLRVFDYSNKSAKFAGQYIMTELSKSKFGFQSEIVTPTPGNVPPNPEIELAITFIKSYFCNNVVAMDFITKTNLFDVLKEVIDYEKGYSLMRLAMELSMTDNLYNISKELDIATIAEALLCSYGYHTRDSVLSKSVNNVTIAMGYHWEKRGLIGQLLDTALEEKPPEWLVMNSIQNTVASILEVRKGSTY